MNPFRYERASDASTAIAILAQAPVGAFLGGGTNLVDLMKLGVAQPQVLIDISRLPYNRVALFSDGSVRIGAAVRNSELAADRTIRTRYPMLAQALLAGASGQLRNLAILGASEACIATHPSDMAVAMVALDAVVRVLGPNGERTIPLTSFHRLPGDEPQRDTVLEHGELITAIDLPPLAFAARSHYRKVRDRASYAFALVSVAAAIDVADGLVRDTRIAFGGIAHIPWRATKAEAVLRGAPATEEVFRRAAEAELADAQPLRENAFKVPLARNTLVRTLLDLTQEEKR